LEKNQQLILTSLHSLRTTQNYLLSRPPVIAPHHTTSTTALLGGGPHLLPGAISLAHTGVLILDELSEFNRQALESLRQPLSNGNISIDRAGGHIIYPADFQLLATTNPCPCGYAASTTKKCHCSPQAIHQYQKKLVGPFTDRVEMTVFLDRAESDMPATLPSDSASWPHKIKLIRDNSRQRLKRRLNIDRPSNHHLTESELKQYAPLSAAAQQLLGKIINHHQQLHLLFLTVKKKNLI
jgi:magnesium chelatase family protein